MNISDLNFVYFLSTVKSKPLLKIVVKYIPLNLVVSAFLNQWLDVLIIYKKNCFILSKDEFHSLKNSKRTFYEFCILSYELAFNYFHLTKTQNKNRNKIHLNTVLFYTRCNKCSIKFLDREFFFHSWFPYALYGMNLNRNLWLDICIIHTYNIFE